MKQTKVMSVFDGVEMQKYFLYLTKEAQEAAYNAVIETLGMPLDYEDFMYEIKNDSKLKSLIQDMILYSIANIDWNTSLENSLQL